MVRKLYKASIFGVYGRDIATKGKYIFRYPDVKSGIIDQQFTLSISYYNRLSVAFCEHSLLTRYSELSQFLDYFYWLPSWRIKDSKWLTTLSVVMSLLIAYTFPFAQRCSSFLSLPILILLPTPPCLSYLPFFPIYTGTILSVGNLIEGKLSFPISLLEDQ